MERDRRGAIGRWLLASAIGASGLCLGALHTPVLAVVALVAAAACALLWYDAEPMTPRPAATALVALGVGLVAWTVLQTVPLPRGLVALIAPATADVWARALAPLREDGPAWISLSLDPNAGRLQVLRGVTYLAVFLGALQVARRQEGVAFLERVVVASTTVTAAAALLHPALGARKVFGIYAPKESYSYMADHIGPLLNMNHLAGYANIGVLVAWGSVLSRKGAIPRPLALVVVALLGATSVWSMSRGGTATMLVGMVVVVVLALGARRARQPGSLPQVGFGVAAIVGAAVVLLSLFDDTRSKFLHGNLSKLELARDAASLWRSFGAFGVGRGAFESVFPSVRTDTEYFVYTHPENVVVQWTTEWGLPLGLLGLAVVAWSLRPRTLLARSRPPIGAWAGLLAVGLQNLVDFSSEIPGVMFALATCAAIVTGGTGGTSLRARARWARRERRVAIAPAVAIVLAGLLVVPATGHELYNEQRSFLAIGADSSRPLGAFHEALRGAMLRHPAEPYFPYVGAVRAVVTREESILPWAARALERSPVFGRMHLLLARSLFVRHAAQARLEYRLACEQDRGACAVAESERLVQSRDDAMELVPAGQRGVDVLDELAARLGKRLPSTVVALDRELLERDPTRLGPARRTSEGDLRDLLDEAPWCVDERTRCIEDGLAAAARVTAMAPETCEGYALASELRVAAGDVERGFVDLDHAIDRVVDRSACAQRLVQLAVRTKNTSRIDAALDRLSRIGCEGPSECAANLLVAAGVETERGNARRALALVKRAWERAPEREDLLVDVAQRAAAQNLHGEALDAYVKLATRSPDDPRWKAAVAREREAISRGIFQPRP